MENWRMLARELYSMLEKGKKLITAFAPTGFGKTMSSPHLLALAREAGLASRLIHVVPTRALLRQIYVEKFVETCRELGLGVAYQSADRIPGGAKSPYFLADLVVTTLESFLLNAYKFPPSEIAKVLEGVSEGHYYPSFAAIASSMVVMDEAHIYLGEPEGGGSGALVASAVAALSKADVPVVLESATMSVRMLESFVERAELAKEEAGVVYACPDEGGSLCPQVRRLKEVGLEVRLLTAGSTASPKWETRVVSSLGEAVENARRLCRDRLVLFISNSVGRAIDVYSSLKGECDSVLLHALLSERDKEVALERRMRDLRSAGRGLIVASPIVDVGVDINADTLVTEPAPVENLAQRAGRLCRGPGGCERAEVLVVGDASLSGPFSGKLTSFALEQLSARVEVEWRLLWGSSSGRTYVDVLESAASRYPDEYSVTVFKVFEGIVSQDSRPLDVIGELVDKFGGLSLVKVATGWPGGVEDLERGAYVLSDLKSLRRFEQKCLESVQDSRGSQLVLATVVRTEEGLKVRRCLSEALFNALRYGRVSLGIARRLRHELRECLDEGEHALDYFLVIKPGCYEEGVGMRVG